MALYACCRSPLRRGIDLADPVRDDLLSSPNAGRLGHPGLALSEPCPSVHSSLRPAYSLTSPNEALSMGFTSRDLSSKRHPSYAVRVFYRFGTFTLWTHEFLQASPALVHGPILRAEREWSDRSCHAAALRHPERGQAAEDLRPDPSLRSLPSERSSAHPAAKDRSGPNDGVLGARTSIRSRPPVPGSASELVHISDVAIALTERW